MVVFNIRRRSGCADIGKRVSNVRVRGSVAVKTAKGEK